ncbi:MAG TPA: hypothetical protein VFU15_02520 [Bacteroidia bacterium]|nr:hypothetical protein [Bacteroidia bacterium]
MFGIIGGPGWLFVLLVLIDIGFVFAMTILWLRSMNNTMDACPVYSRTAEPALVWLTLIPLFGFVWQFIAVFNVSNSLAKEYARRKWSSEENRPALETGIIACIAVVVVTFVRLFFPIHPGIGFIGSMVVAFCMYRHMDRMQAYRERLEKERDPTLQFGQITPKKEVPNPFADLYPKAGVSYPPAAIVHHQQKNTASSMKNRSTPLPGNTSSYGEVPPEYSPWMPKPDKKDEK